MRSFSIRTRIFLGTLAVLLVFVVAGSLVLDGMVDGVLERELAEGSARARVTSERFLELELELLESEVRSVAQVPHLRAVLDTPGVDAETLRFTATTIAEAAGMERIFIASPDGEVIAERGGLAPAHADLRPKNAWQNVLEGELWSGVVEWYGAPHLVAVGPVALGGTLLGALGLSRPVDEDLLRELAVATAREVTLLDAAAAPVACVRDPSTPAAEAAWFASVGAWVGGTPEGSGLLEASGDEFLATAFPLGDGVATLVLSHPLEQVLGPHREAHRDLGWLGAGILLAALAVAYDLSRRIGRPIQALTHAADELAAGRFDATVAVRGNDELAVLGRRFNEMAGQISTLLDRAIERAQAAQVANEAKSAFLATMGHEVRTPLNAILGFADLLRETELEPAQLEQVAAVRQSGEELLQIVGDVLDYTDLESGKLEFTEQEFDVAPLVERVTGPAAVEARRLGLRMETRIARDVPPRLGGRPEAVRRLLKHYVDNALKFTQHGSVTVVVHADVEEGDELTLRISVQDTGIGIPEAARARVFEPFLQADSSNSRRFGGSGLGLAICSDLAELLGGECGLESREGEGSTFWFTAPVRRAREVPEADGPLPAVVATPDAKPVAPVGDARARRADQRILLVEDNPLNQRVASLVLRKAGWSHELAQHGEEALAKLAEEPFDLVLMDCQMPIMDGFEATRRQREREADLGGHVPIVALTANAMRSDREACLASGMDDFVAKPFQAAHLIEVLERWLQAAEASD